MPLDVKPLSPARRATMVVVMVALFGASLGFAQLLVLRQQHHVANSAVFRMPPGAGTLAVNTDMRRIREWLWYAEHGEIRKALPVSCRVGSGAQARRYTLFSLADLSRGQTSAEEYLLFLFATMTANPALEKLPVALQEKLGGAEALQTESDIALNDLLGEQVESEPKSSPSAFAIMRLAIVNDQVIAVGFSGAGRPSDADRQSFDDYCQSVRVAD